METETLSIPEAAARLRCHRNTIGYLMKIGKLGYLRLGPRGRRIPVAALESYVAENTVAASGRRRSQRSNRLVTARSSGSN